MERPDPRTAFAGGQNSTTVPESVIRELKAKDAVIKKLEAELIMANEDYDGLKVVIDEWSRHCDGLRSKVKVYKRLLVLNGVGYRKKEVNAAQEISDEEWYRVAEGARERGVFDESTDDESWADDTDDDDVERDEETMEL